MKTILCINGSDSMGHTGIQADVRTIKDIGGYAVTAVTSVTVQNSHGIAEVYNLPADIVTGQVKAIYEETHPDAVKVGMINNAKTIRNIRDEIVGCQQIVCSPVILSSHGGLLMSNDSIRSYCEHLLPICTLLVVKCTDAEIILGHRICTDNDMLLAAQELHQLGAGNILLRGGTYCEGRINALLYSPTASVSSSLRSASPSATSVSSSSRGATPSPREGRGESSSFFSSVNIEGWQRHGVGGTLSTAIASRLALGDDITQAVSNAHNYIHSQVVYASQKQATLQPHNLYDKFMTLLADNYTKAHDVAFYASQLAISTRYLSQITGTISGRSPKQIIDEYLIRESEKLLHATTLSIQQISYQLGFSSQIAFAKFFKAKKGKAPREERK